MPELKYVELPSYMQNDRGKLATFMPDIDTSQGQVHLLCPSGIGDVAWPWSKYWWVQEWLASEGRELVWHFPADQHRRVDPYARLVGMNVGQYLPIDIKELLSYPCEWELKDFREGGVFYLHANRHLEEGKPLHCGAPKYKAYNVVSGNVLPLSMQTWHPWLEFRNPAPEVREVGAGERPPHVGTNEAVWRDSTRKPFVVMHMASAIYCEGNLFPRHWAKLIERVEGHFPVQLVGAKWDEDFIEHVTDFYTPALPPMVGQTLAAVLSAIVSSSGMIGVDSGLTILATYMGKAALRCYPRWLRLMPGTWEDCDTLHPHNRWIHMDELLETYEAWIQSLARMS